MDTGSQNLSRSFWGPIITYMYMTNTTRGALFYGILNLAVVSREAKLKGEEDFLRAKYMTIHQTGPGSLLPFSGHFSDVSHILVERRQRGPKKTRRSPKGQCVLSGDQEIYTEVATVNEAF